MLLSMIYYILAPDILISYESMLKIKNNLFWQQQYLLQI